MIKRMENRQLTEPESRRIWSVYIALTLLAPYVENAKDLEWIYKRIDKFFGLKTTKPRGEK